MGFLVDLYRLDRIVEDNVNDLVARAVALLGDLIELIQRGFLDSYGNHLVSVVTLFIYFNGTVGHVHHLLV